MAISTWKAEIWRGSRKNLIHFQFHQSILTSTAHQGSTSGHSLAQKMSAAARQVWHVKPSPITSGKPSDNGFRFHEMTTRRLVLTHINKLRRVDGAAAEPLRRVPRRERSKQVALGPLAAGQLSLLPECYPDQLHGWLKCYSNLFYVTAYKVHISIVVCNSTSLEQGVIHHV